MNYHSLIVPKPGPIFYRVCGKRPTVRTVDPEVEVPSFYCHSKGSLALSGYNTADNPCLTARLAPWASACISMVSFGSVTTFSFLIMLQLDQGPGPVVAQLSGHPVHFRETRSITVCSYVVPGNFSRYRSPLIHLPLSFLSSVSLCWTTSKP
jgi:hypothetical protein